MALFEYRYLNVISGSAVSSLDVNGASVFTINATANFITESIGVDKSTNYTDYRITPASITGTTGTLTYQTSQDGINWDTVKDNSGNDIVYTVNGSMATVRVHNEVVRGTQERWNFSKGDTSVGTITISVVRG